MTSKIGFVFSNSILLDMDLPSAASGFALGRNQKIEGRLSQIRRMFFASAFLFTASAFGEGGEKRTTAKNKSRKFLFEKRLIRYYK